MWLHQFICVVLPLLLTSGNSLANDQKKQKFNDFTASFKLSQIDYNSTLISFSGEVWVSGEVVFELIHTDEIEEDIYKIALIPDELELFPTVVDGYYEKPLTTIALINHADIRKEFFTDHEWSEFKTQKVPYVSKRASILIDSYATSVECDSRHYFAKFKKLKASESTASKSDERKELLGC